MFGLANGTGILDVRRAMSPVLFAEDAGGDSTGTTGAEGNDTGTDAGTGNEPGTAGTEETEALKAKIAKLEAENAKQKKSIDNATKEAAQYKRQLREHQTVEEAAAEELKAAKEANEAELNELRKKFAVMETTKNVAVKLSSDEATAEKIANMLYGAEDADGALIEIQKLMAAREKAMKLEFGKIPAPSAGGTDGPTITRNQLDGMGYKERLDFSRKHPEEYNKLMGR